MGTSVLHCLLIPLLLVVLVTAQEPPTKKAVDPDANRNVSQIIADKGYPVQEFEVVTSDGFVIGLQRIPSGKSGASRPHIRAKKTVFLQHGLLGSSTDWVVNYPSQSLGALFILAIVAVLPEAEVRSRSE